ncbi:MULTISPECIES: DMT family transporter [Bacillus]|uniref:DMT family transporter n=1 Tax=Bacillus TaxID=1386 RepID=UPI00040A2205|nr:MULTISPECIES: multidrug efflux SMR transporter [Bacillus]QHZ48275.1 multidrug efflux SMR transporter [Bacillus sp. NSP9.1]WFA06059.1 multidrug efflux SMR transporter [Bacillus sp. HSf4]
MHWLYLCLAILFETAGTISMKLSNGFSKIIPSILLLVFYAASLVFLTLTLKTMDIAVAYAVWSGLGIVFISVMGFLYFGESISLLKVISIILIITGVVALNVAEHRPIN